MEILINNSFDNSNDDLDLIQNDENIFEDEFSTCTNSNNLIKKKRKKLNVGKDDITINELKNIIQNLNNRNKEIKITKKFKINYSKTRKKVIKLIIEHILKFLNLYFNQTQTSFKFNIPHYLLKEIIKKINNCFLTIDVKILLTSFYKNISNETIFQMIEENIKNFENNQFFQIDLQF